MSKGKCTGGDSRSGIGLEGDISSLKNISSITLFSGKRQGMFIRAGAFIRINTVICRKLAYLP